MRKSDIWIVIEDSKVFQLSEIVEVLLKEWEFLGKNYVRNKVQSAVYSWITCGLIVKVNDAPPVFALKKYAGNWKEHYSGIKTCPVCGTPFISKRGEQDRYCSKKCYEKAKTRRSKEKTRERVKNYLHSADSTAVNKYKEWTEKDIEILRKLKEKGKSCREIATELGRTVYSVRWKLQRLKEAGYAS